jgi:hypothetical protein
MSDRRKVLVGAFRVILCSCQISSCLLDRVIGIVKVEST